MRAEAKVGEWKHPGVLKSDVAAFMRGWPAEKRRQAQHQEEAEAARLRDLQEEDKLVLWIKEELLPDRYADKEKAHFLEQYPELRGYNPPPEHFRAVDRCYVRRALMEIGRTNCPPDEKQRQRGRLAELEQIWPGIVDEVKREDEG